MKEGYKDPYLINHQEKKEIELKKVAAKGSKAEQKTNREPDHVKKQKWFKMNPKPKDSVFAALCSTLSQAVLPAKKTAANAHASPHAGEERTSSGDDNQEKASNVPRITSSEDNSSTTTAEENHIEKETADSRNCSDHLHENSDNRQLDSEDCQLATPKSSSEMAVNGS